MPAISVKNLSKTFEYYKKTPGLRGAIQALFGREKLYTRAVDDISFDIENGELVGFLGPNGAGKTTTLKILAGILYPSAGQAEILGYTPWKRQNAYKRQFAFVMGQKSQLWWDLPAMETFILNREIYEIDEAAFQKTLDELTELLDIGDILKVPVRQLSLGQRMKCEIAASLIHSPRVLFLDEPTIGLDVIAQKKMRDFIWRYNREHATTIILTSHYMEDIAALCKRVIIVNLGKIIYDGPLASLIEKYSPYKLLKISFLNDIREADLKKFGRVTLADDGLFHLEVPRGQSTKIAAEILNKFPVDDLLIDEPEIRDVIRLIFGKAQTKTAIG